MAELNEVQQARKVAQEYIKANLPELCAELVEWMDTAKLKNGKVRELAKLCDYAGDDALSVAEADVKYYALAACAGTSTSA